MLDFYHNFVLDALAQMGGRDAQNVGSEKGIPLKWQSYF